MAFSVEVNNTHNVSYGGSNNVNNIAYSKYSTAGGSTATSTSTATKGATTAKAYPKYAEPRDKDQDVVVLLPHRKNRTPRLKHKLSVRALTLLRALLSAPIRFKLTKRVVQKANVHTESFRHSHTLHVRFYF